MAINARYSSMIKLKKRISQLLLDHKVKKGLQITILSYVEKFSIDVVFFKQ